MKFRDFLKRQKRHDSNAASIQMVYPFDELELSNSPDNRSTLLAKDTRSFLENGIWNVYPIAMSRYQVFIVCPFCGDIHCHGNTGGDFSGMRVSHCVGIRGEYNLVES